MFPSREAAQPTARLMELQGNSPGANVNLIACFLPCQNKYMRKSYCTITTNFIFSPKADALFLHNPHNAPVQ